MSNRSMPNSPPDRSSWRSQVELGVMIASMLVVGLAGWKLSERANLSVDASALAALPGRIGPWESVEIPMEAAVEAELRADFNLQRAYVTRAQDPVVLYVGYYGTRRGGRPEHNPQGCYTGAGWGIEATRTLSMGQDGPLRANEYLVERDGVQQLVVFWYRSFRRTGILGGLDQNLDRLMGLLRDGRADGALVRISTLIHEGDVVGARSRLQSFASLVDPLLGRHWPVEFACEAASGGRCEAGAEPTSGASVAALAPGRG